MTGLFFGVGCVIVSLMVGGDAVERLPGARSRLPGSSPAGQLALCPGGVRAYGLAALNDLVWAVVMFPLLAVLIATDHATVTSMTLVWVVGANTSAIVGLFQTGVLPRLHLLSWWRKHRDLGTATSASSSWREAPASSRCMPWAPSRVSRPWGRSAPRPFSSGRSTCC